MLILDQLDEGVLEAGFNGLQATQTPALAGDDPRQPVVRGGHVDHVDHPGLTTALQPGEPVFTCQRLGQCGMLLDQFDPQFLAAAVSRAQCLGAVGCHGASGRGDGPLARRMSKPPANLVDGPFPWTPAGGDLETRVARVIKFGVPGSDMPGHEVMTDDQIIALAREVIRLREQPKDP